MKAVKIGILGPGKIAHKFADACARVPQAELAAVASTNEQRAQQFAQQYAIPHAYGSYAQLLADETIDAVYISVVNPLHLQTIQLAAKAGKAILCEKPAVMTRAQAQQLEAAVKENNVLFIEGVWTLFLPAVEKARVWLKSGMIGTPQWMDVTFSYRADAPTDRVFAEGIEGGALVDVGVYAIGLAEFMAQEKVSSVKGMCKKTPAGVDTYGTALLQYPSGFIAECHFGVDVARCQNINIWGEAGRIEMEKRGDFQHIFRYDASGELVETFTSEYDNGFVYEIMELCRLVEAGETESPVLPLAQSMQYVEIYEKVRENWA